MLKFALWKKDDRQKDESVRCLGCVLMLKMAEGSEVMIVLEIINK